jgi:hypothetical protein
LMYEDFIESQMKCNYKFYLNNILNNIWNYILL